MSQNGFWILWIRLLFMSIFASESQFKTWPYSLQKATFVSSSEIKDEQILHTVCKLNWFFFFQIFAQNHKSYFNSLKFYSVNYGILLGLILDNFRKIHLLKHFKILLLRSFTYVFLQINSMALIYHLTTSRLLM